MDLSSYGRGFTGADMDNGNVRGVTFNITADWEISYQRCNINLAGNRRSRYHSISMITEEGALELSAFEGVTSSQKGIRDEVWFR